MITKEEIESLGWYTTDDKFYYLDDKRVTSHSGEYFLDGHLVSYDSYEMFRDKNNTFSIIKNLSQVYDCDYFENGIATKKSNYVDYSWERLGHYFQKTATHIVDKFKPEKSLDVGCAKGYLTKGLFDLGVDAYGIEPSEYALSEACPDIKDKLTKGIAQSVSFPDNSFDVVTCFDVLEHLS